MPAQKINSAIRDCLDQCYASENPLGGVARFLNRLSENPGWDESEIEQVETTVRKILKAVVIETPSESND